MSSIRDNLSGFDFPSGLNFSLKKNAIASKMRQMVHIPIAGPVANPLDPVTFSLATGSYGMYLSPTESYITFTINNKDASNNINIDGSAYSFIDRLTVSSSGTTITDLQYYGAWANMVLDSQAGVGRAGAMSTFAGCQTQASLNETRGGMSIAANGSLTVSIPLMGCALSGDSTDKYIPVGAMGDLQLLMNIADKNSPVYTTITTVTSANWTLSNISLTCNYVTLDAGAQKMLDEAQGGSYMWSCELWKGYNFTVGGSQSDNVIVPIKCSSLKTIFAIQRYAANISNVAQLTNTSRITAYAAPNSATASSFFVTVGSEVYPGIPLKNTAHHAIEFQKAWHSLGNPAGLQTSFDYNTWNGSGLSGGTCLDAAGITTNQASNPYTPSTAGSFVNALNLECYTGKAGALHSGVPVLGGTTLILNQNYGATLATAYAVLQTTFCHFDGIASVKDGVFTMNF